MIFCHSGISPIVIDNTNTQKWEAKPYVQMAQSHGYTVKVMEPTTPWAKNAQELTQRNQHGVPLHVIRLMLQRWETDFTVEAILASQKPRFSRREPWSGNEKKTKDILPAPPSAATSACAVAKSSDARFYGDMDATGVPKNDDHSNIKDQPIQEHILKAKARVSKLGERRSLDHSNITRRFIIHYQHFQSLRIRMDHWEIYLRELREAMKHDFPSMCFPPSMLEPIPEPLLSYPIAIKQVTDQNPMMTKLQVLVHMNTQIDTLFKNEESRWVRLERELERIWCKRIWCKELESGAKVGKNMVQCRLKRQRHEEVSFDLQDDELIALGTDVSTE